MDPSGLMVADPAALEAAKVKPATSQTIAEGKAEPVPPEAAASEAAVRAEHGAVPSGPAMVEGQEVDVTGGVVPGEEEQAAILAGSPEGQAALRRTAAKQAQSIPQAEARRGEESISEAVRDDASKGFLDQYKDFARERLLEITRKQNSPELTERVEALLNTVTLPSEAVIGDSLASLLTGQGMDKETAKEVGFWASAVVSTLYGVKSPTAFGGKLAGGAEAVGKLVKPGIVDDLSPEELLQVTSESRRAASAARDFPAVERAIGITEMAPPKGTPVFHGTGTDFAKIDAGEGFWVAESPKTAGHYALSANRGQAPNIRPMVLAEDAKIADESAFNFELSQAQNAEILRERGIDAVRLEGVDTGKGVNYFVANPAVVVERFTGKTAAVVQKLADDAGVDPRFAQEAILATRRLVRDGGEDAATLTEALADAGRRSGVDQVAPSMTDNEKGLAMAGGAAALLAMSVQAEQEGGVTEDHVTAALPVSAGNKKVMQAVIAAVRKLRNVPGKVKTIPPATAEQAMDLLTSPGTTARIGDKLLGFDWVGMSQDADNLPNTIKQVQQVFEDAIKADSRGVVSHEMERRMAQELLDMGLDADSVKAKWAEGGRAVISTEIAATALLTKAAYKEVERLAGIATKLDGAQGSLEEYGRAAGVFSSLITTLSGQAEEAGRALGVFRSMIPDIPQGARAFGKQQGELAAKGLTPAEGQEAYATYLRTMLDAWNGLPKSQQRGMFFKELVKWGLDGVKELWYSSMLFTFPGQLANAIGNSSAMFGESMSKALGAGIGAVRHGALGLGPKGAEFGEMTEGSFVGMMSSITEAFVAAGKSWVTGTPESIAIMGGSQTKTPRAITGQRAEEVMALANVQIPNAVYHGINVLGMTLGAGTRSMLAGDEWFKVINFRGEMYRLGYVEAQRQGLKGKEFGAFMETFLSSPPAEAIKTAKGYAHYVTFTSPLTGKLGMASQIGKSLPMLPFTPFFDTLVNIFKYEMEWMPGLNLMVKKSREDLMTPGPRQDQALAKLGLGSAMLAVGAMLYMNGNLSGPGPQDYNMLRTMKDVNKYEPNSFVFRGPDGARHYIGINRFDPINFPFLFAAAYGDISLEALNGRGVSRETLDELALAGVMALGDVATTRNYMQGWQQALELALAKDMSTYNKLAKLGNRIAGQVVPSAGAQITRSTDEQVRATYSALDVIYSRLPWMSKGLYSQVNMKGEPRFRTAALGPDWVSPIPYSKEEMDPVGKSFLANGVSIEKPSRSLFGPPPPAFIGEDRPHHGILMTPEQQFKYEVMAGNGLKVPASNVAPALEALGYQGELPTQKMGMWDIQTALLKSKAFTKLEPAMQGKIQRYIVQSFRQAAAGQLLKQDKELREKFFDKVLDRAELFGGSRARGMAEQAIRENDMDTVLSMTGNE